jgi:hypothetical protein
MPLGPDQRSANGCGAVSVVDAGPSSVVSAGPVAEAPPAPGFFGWPGGVEGVADGWPVEAGGGVDGVADGGLVPPGALS